MLQLIVTLAALCTGCLWCTQASAQSGRDYLTAVGSSTVYPFATVVAESFGRRTVFKTPKIEATGSGGGFKQFCAGVGIGFPDLTSASRRMKATELQRCRDNGVDVVEVPFGYDGIVLANAVNAPAFRLTRREVWLALAQRVPDANGQLIPNPNRRWSEIRAGLPDTKIVVLGPPPTSGTRDALVELVMEAGCREFPAIERLEQTNPVVFRALCHTIREDGAFVEVGESDNLVVQKLYANPDALGLLGFNFLSQNAEKVRAAHVDGETASFAAIASGRYPVSRRLYLYVKVAHVGMLPGLREFVLEFTSERAWGDEGYLTDRGLVPLPAIERAVVRANVMAMSPLRVPARR
ncbi:MAG: substrate-binding domain-containing protein [Pseudomonadota bacterium]